MSRLIIYQALARLWKEGRFSSWDDASFEYLVSLGVDCLWLTGVPRHASGKDFVKGDPGSPYAISDWYDINPYLSDKEEERFDEFKQLISRAHSHGIKILTDFIPNHVARDYEGDLPVLPYCDYDWTDTLKVDYGHPATFGVMTEIVKFWASLGVDGVRCDMVELVPLDFFRALVPAMRASHPDFLFIGEVYDRNNYSPFLDAGFDLLYDKSGLYDILVAIRQGGGTARAVTWNWQYLGGMQGRMLNFLENHDEKRAAAPDSASLAVSALFNGASFMFYFGQEYGECAPEASDARTSIFNWVRKLDPVAQSGSAHTARFREILSLASSEPFRSGGNWDLCYAQTDPAFNPDRHFAFLRFDGSRCFLVLCNFSDEDVSLDIRIPEEAPAISAPGRTIKAGAAARDCTVISIR